MTKRVMQTKQSEMSIETLCKIEETDIIEAEYHYLESRCLRELSPRAIGFRA